MDLCVYAFSTRTIYLETVKDLISSAFIAAFQKFMVRRIKCITIYSGNVTHFIGAQRELSAYLSKINSKMANEGI